MKILIVDDIKESLYLLERMIKKIGYEVVMAEKGERFKNILYYKKINPKIISLIKKRKI